MTPWELQKHGGLRDERGSLAVEMAILLPIVFALVFAAIDISRVLLARGLVDQLGVELSNSLKYETTPAARALLTEETLQGRLSSLSEGLSGGLIDPSRLELSVFPYNDLTALVSETASGGLIGLPEAVTAIRLEYAVPLTTPFANFFYETGDSVQSSMVVINNGR